MIEEKRGSGSIGILRLAPSPTMEAGEVEDISFPRSTSASGSTCQCSRS